MSVSPSSDLLALGIDVGTSSTKAAVFSLAEPATPIAVARRESAPHSPRFGWSETDADHVLDLVFECIAEVCVAVDATRISSIGVSGTACGVWLLGSDRRPVRDPILWNDGRSADIVESWSDDGFAAEIFRRTGNVLFNGYTLPTLTWMDRHEPDALAAGSTLVFCKDWVRLALTGEISTDATDASYVPFDIRAGEWDVDLFERAGIGHLTRLLPPIRDEQHTAPLLPEVAARFGLPAGIAVGVGATDIVAGLVGGGAVRPGRAVTILGTSANSSIVTAKPEFDPVDVGIMAVSARGTYARTMINTSGTSTFDWAASAFAGGDLTALLAAADRADPAADRPVLVPYLSRAGTVSPLPDPNARGVLAGLRVDHTQADLALSAIEGLAFSVVDSFACMTVQPDEILAVGGAAQSSLLLQTIADGMGTRVVKPLGGEFGARGVALLAARAAGELSDAEFDHAAESLSIETVCTPAHDADPRSLERYRAARDATAPLWRTW